MISALNLTGRGGFPYTYLLASKLNAICVERFSASEKGNNGWRLDPQLAPFRQTKAARVECLSSTLV